MLEQVDLTRSLSKAEYKRRMDALKLKLYSVGHAVYESQTPVVIVFEGWSASGRGQSIAELTSQLDPRGFRVYPVAEPRPHELRFPWFYRFWLMTPAQGEISIFYSSWYRRVLLERMIGETSEKELVRAYQDIRDFERMLADDGAVLIKFWLEISKKEQKRRLEVLLEQQATAWQVGRADKVQQKHRRAYAQAVEEMFGQTEAEYAPWTIIAATDRRWTDVQVYETVISRLQPHIAANEVPLPDDLEEQLRAIERDDGVTLTGAIAKPVPPANPEVEAGATNA